jgi:hypothetical protein
MNPCAKCGQLHTRCGGHRKRDGQPCGRPPRTGAKVCPVHGGGAPQVKAAADRRVAEEQARKQINRILDDPDAAPVTDALGALARLAGRLEHAVDEIGRRASDLRSVGVQTVAGGEQLRAELQLWDKLLGHQVRSLDMLVKHGYAERQIAMAEREAEMHGQLVAVALDAAGVAGQARAAGIAASRERFLLLAGGAS